MEHTIEELMNIYEPYFVYIDTEDVEVKLYNTSERTFEYRNGKITPMDDYTDYDICTDTVTSIMFHPIKKVVFKDYNFTIPRRCFLLQFEDLDEDEKEPFLHSMDVLDYYEKWYNGYTYTGEYNL